MRQVDELPDVRDGLTHKQRIILTCLRELQRELGREFVPTIMLYGRVLEKLDISEQELQQAIASL